MYYLLLFSIGILSSGFTEEATQELIDPVKWGNMEFLCFHQILVVFIELFISGVFSCMEFAKSVLFFTQQPIRELSKIMV